ncbi:uncharacterized protein MJAP1_001530 [Malassezia japonica]|uniref:BCNT-C domain-containing protein n=1 Tax=Malassezia japonica TaxID=223818 RepID=A0AAF0F526_9BASI|nr:uncharacterized protein MJAP1_001530 [Malassezia japonica]WFD38572.1 hypothetical protein MJAP1_001530 [Malassezia japonica]
MAQESAAAPPVEKKDVLPKADANEKCDENSSQKADAPEAVTSESAPDDKKAPASSDEPPKKEPAADTNPAQETKTKKPLSAPVKKRTSQLGALATNTRKKRKSQLADLSAAVTAQPVKLNTLEKSKLDWESYKGTVPAAETETMTDAERDELESQTHGGGSGLANVKGYLHRKEFLDRVHNRLDSQEYDAHHSLK